MVHDKIFSSQKLELFPHRLTTNFLDIQPLWREPKLLDDFAPLNQSDRHHNEGDDQQNMNESAQRIATDQAQQPQDQENDSYRPNHLLLFSDGTTHPPISNH